VAVNQEDSFILPFLINSMVKLTKVIHKEVDHDDKVKDRMDGEMFKGKEIGCIFSRSGIIMFGYLRGYNGWKTVSVISVCGKGSLHDDYSIKR